MSMRAWATGELTGAGVEIDSAITLKVDRSPGFPNSSPVVETTRVVEDAEEYLTSARGGRMGRRAQSGVA